MGGKKQEERRKKDGFFVSTSFFLLVKQFRPSVLYTSSWPNKLSFCQRCSCVAIALFAFSFDVKVFLLPRWKYVFSPATGEVNVGACVRSCLVGGKKTHNMILCFFFFLDYKREFFYFTFGLGKGQMPSPLNVFSSLSSGAQKGETFPL